MRLISVLGKQHSLARSVERAKHEVPRFPVRESACADSLMRRCFARVLLLMNLVGEESPRCLTLSADRAKPFPVEQAAEPMGYLNYSESAYLFSNRLSEGAKRMSLPE